MNIFCFVIIAKFRPVFTIRSILYFRTEVGFLDFLRMNTDYTITFFLVSTLEWCSLNAFLDGVIKCKAQNKRTRVKQ